MHRSSAIRSDVVFARKEYAALPALPAVLVLRVVYFDPYLVEFGSGFRVKGVLAIESATGDRQ